MGNKVNKSKKRRGWRKINAKRLQEELRLKRIQRGGPSSSADVSKDVKENAAEGQQILCQQIKDNLKRLRRQSNNDEDEPHSEKNEEAPHLILNVFPDADNTIDTIDHENGSNINDELGTEFHDESQTEELPETGTDHLVPRLPPKPKPQKQRIKPKRNPLRRVVIEKQIQNDLITAQKAPALEKVFVNSLNKAVVVGPTPKRARIDTSEMPSHIDHTDKLYEYGKYVAEQMMCFDDKDFRLAQAEINEVLSKYKLKYKILNCISKPSHGKSNEVTKSASGAKSAGPSVTKSASGAKSAGRSVTKSASVAKSAGRSVTKSASGANSVGRPRLKTSQSQFEPKVTTPNSLVTQAGLLVNNAGFSETQFWSPVNSAGSLVTQSGSLVNNAGSLATGSLVNVGPLMPQLVSGGAPMVPLGIVIVPSVDANSFHITTQRMDPPMGTVSLAQPESLPVISSGSVVTQFGSSHATSTRNAETQPESSHGSTDKRQVVNIVTVSGERETIIIKTEDDSDDNEVEGGET